MLGKKGRIIPLTGARECISLIEEKDPDPNSVYFMSDPHSPDAPSESKNSGDDNAVGSPNGMDESLDSNLTDLLISSEVPSSGTNLHVSSPLGPPPMMPNTPLSIHMEVIGEVNREHLQGASAQGASSTEEPCNKKERAAGEDKAVDPKRPRRSRLDSEPSGEESTSHVAQALTIYYLD
jgi:hypothetical protein